MNNYKTKSCCVYDYGLYVELACKLSESFGQVYYYTPWQSPFPISNHQLPGYGLKNIERINHFWDIVDDVDLFVFPDVYCGDIQVHLDKMGKRVWGSKKGEELEMYRKESKNYMRSIGILIGDFEIVKGTDNLRKYLKSHPKQYVKISSTRGDFETFYAKNYKQIEPRIDEIEWHLGAKKYIMEFIVEKEISPAVETGYDGYCIDGQFPNASLWGIEVKDKGYVGKFVSNETMPEQVREYNDKISDTMKKYKYRNFMSTEIRVDKAGNGYMIDPANRLGSPPSELYTSMFKNLADIIWEGSGGKCIDPVVDEEYGIEVMLSSKWADNNWQPISFPEEIRSYIKLRNLAMINGDYYVVPQGSGHSEIGAIISTGKSFEEAKEKIKEYAEKISSFDLTINVDAIDDAEEEFDKLKKFIGVTPL